MTTARDRAVVIPLILIVVAAVLLVLLRSVIATLCLIITVVATYVASLGAGNFLFHNVFHFAAFDTGVLLYAFLFLVALGVDYNIFLTTRAREARNELGAREAMRYALTRTGGVITSAGILLAAVFVVLGVLPVVALARSARSCASACCWTPWWCAHCWCPRWPKYSVNDSGGPLCGLGRRSSARGAEDLDREN